MSDFELNHDTSLNLDKEHLVKNVYNIAAANSFESFFRGSQCETIVIRG
jgi:hypothetical protein